MGPMSLLAAVGREIGAVKVLEVNEAVFRGKDDAVVMGFENFERWEWLCSGAIVIFLRMCFW